MVFFMMIQLYKAEKLYKGFGYVILNTSLQYFHHIFTVSDINCISISNNYTWNTQEQGYSILQIYKANIP